LKIYSRKKSTRNRRAIRLCISSVACHAYAISMLGDKPVDFNNDN